jgi:dihydroorotase-like cyclic amidohydrolase
LVLVDLASSHTVDASRHHDLSGYSLYDGRRLRGAVRTVVAGGEVVASDGELVSPDRRGRFLPRASSEIPSGLS